MQTDIFETPVFGWVIVQFCKTSVYFPESLVISYFLLNLCDKTFASLIHPIRMKLTCNICRSIQRTPCNIVTKSWAVCSGEISFSNFLKLI